LGGIRGRVLEHAFPVLERFAGQQRIDTQRRLVGQQRKQQLVVGRRLVGWG